jgi:aspartyl-tRNA(Asn)/glutamyl-tRNA(Gln) amidotransferase subunit C
MTDGSVDPEAVAHVAALARVDLDEDEIEAFAAQFADVLDYFETLDEVPEIESDPDLVNVLRTDEARTSLAQTEALRNAPETDEGYFEGPPVG